MNLVLENLKLFIPALVQLVDGRDFPWDSIDLLFSEKIKDRISKLTGETLEIEASIYDIIVEAKKQNSKAIGLLHFLNKLFEELTDTLETNEKLLVKSNVKQMLTSLDSKYLDFLGEIATLNNLIKSKMYRLVAIEEKLPNGKSIDFKLRHIEQNKFYLVEIVNIHLNSNRVEDNPDAIRKFLTHRLSNKLKAKNLKLDNGTIFYLIPVIWGGWQQIKIYSNFFRTNGLGLQNVIEPVSYLTYTDGAGYYEHYFKTVSNLFK